LGGKKESIMRHNNMKRQYMMIHNNSKIMYDNKERVWKTKSENMEKLRNNIENRNVSAQLETRMK